MMAAITKDSLTYPVVRRDESVKDEFHGVSVSDPYRWLESNSDETRKFVTDENEVTKAYYSKCTDQRDVTLAKLKQYQNYERVSCPFQRGENTFIFRNTGLQNQDVMYKLNNLDEKLRFNEEAGPFKDAVVFMDLNAEYPDGTTSLGSTSFSKDGKLFAYGLQHAGSDWQTVYVRNCQTTEKLADEIKWAKFTSIAWAPNNAGFYYTRYPAPSTTDAGTETDKNENCAVYYHALGTSASEDVIIYEDATHPTWRYGVETSDDEKYLIISVYKGTDPVNRVYIAELNTASPGSLQVFALIGNYEAQYSYVASRGSRLVFLTNLRAPKYRLVTVEFDSSRCARASESAVADTATPDMHELLAETDDVLDWAASCAQDFIVCCYIKHATNVLTYMQLKDETPLAISAPAQLSLPAACTVVSSSLRQEHNINFVKLASPVMPGNVFAIERAGSELVTRQWYRISLSDFNSDDFEVKQHFVKSFDGSVSIPMFTVRHRDNVGTPAHTLLYVYGGFNVSLLPNFSAVRLAWISHLKGNYALACIRGGGEYGELWHKAGSRLNKQNCFDDTAACGEYLMHNGFTPSGGLAIMGGSNGGLGVLVAGLQKPKLYRAVVAQVPVTDMLRFHKFTIGSAWRGEYGYIEEEEADFHNVMKYSPLHVAERGAFERPLPSILITTGDHDDRVVPLHSYKMIATLQHAAPENPHPLLIRIDVAAGHGAGKPTAKVLEEYADIFTFLHTETTTR